MEIIKEIIHTETITPKNGFDIVVRSICDKDGKNSKNTLVKKTWRITAIGYKWYAGHRGLNLNDLSEIKKNWPKILKAMMK